MAASAMRRVPMRRRKAQIGGVQATGEHAMIIILSTAAIVSLAAFCDLESRR
jgi:hypothetical protein